MLAAGCLAVLLVAWRLNPDSSGHGTHTQLGMAPCGWLVVTGKPCMTCGMTTSFAHAAHGELAASFHAQPMGMMLAVVAAACFWGGAYVAATGSRLGSAVARMMGWRMVWAALAMFMAAWVYKLATWGGAG